MADIILIKCGELILKGNNRAKFEDRLVKNTRTPLANLEIFVFGKNKLLCLWREQMKMQTLKR